MVRLSTSLKIPSQLNALVYFLLFLLSNFLLAYFPLSFVLKLEIGLFGLLLPFVFACLKSVNPKEKPPYLQNTFDVSPYWMLVLLAAAIFIRLWKLTSLSTWPQADDSFISYWAMDLCRNWRWHPFFGHVQGMPLTFWLLAFFYKIFSPSLTSLWLFPAFISILTIFVIYAGFRKFFVPSFHFLLVAVSVFSFLFLYPAQFCMWPIVLIFSIVLAFA